MKNYYCYNKHNLHRFSGRLSVGFKLPTFAASAATAKIFMLVLVACVLTLSLLQVFLSGKVATTGLKITQLETQKAQIQLENNRLQTQIDSISSLSYIEQKARNELKMLPAQKNVLFLPLTQSESLASR